jgi:hypothetical protein
MTPIVIASAYIDLFDDHQLYTLAFVDDCDDVCSLIHFTSEEEMMYYCNIYHVDIITSGCEYGCEAMDYETGTPVYYDEHINYASAI